MKKLLMTVIAGSLCAAFGLAYGQANPGSTLQSDKGVKTPKSVEDSHVDLKSKGATDTKAAPKAAAPAPAAAPASAPAPAAAAPVDTGEKKSRRAARREKG